MLIQDPIILNLDIKKKMNIDEPQLTSTDSNAFAINVLDNGKEFDLTGIKLATMAHSRLDKTVIITEGEITGDNQITFVLGRNDTGVIGRVNASVQMYGQDDSRVSTLSFSYQVLKDPTGREFIPSEEERSLIERVLFDAPVIIEEARQSSVDANASAIYANAQGDLAKEVVAMNTNIPLSPVASFAAIATTYPNPVLGNKVQTTDDGKIYRYDGTTWKYVEIMDSNILTDIQTKLVDLKKLVRNRDVFIATANQKVFTLTNSYIPNQNMIDVSVGGVPQYSPTNFTETSSTSFTVLGTGVPVGTEVVASYFS